MQCCHTPSGGRTCYSESAGCLLRTRKSPRHDHFLVDGNGLYCLCLHRIDWTRTISGVEHLISWKRGLAKCQTKIEDKRQNQRDKLHHQQVLPCGRRSVRLHHEAGPNLREGSKLINHTLFQIRTQDVLRRQTIVELKSDEAVKDFTVRAPNSGVSKSWLLAHWEAEYLTGRISFLFRWELQRQHTASLIKP